MTGVCSLNLQINDLHNTPELLLNLSLGRFSLQVKRSVYLCVWVSVCLSPWLAIFLKGIFPTPPPPPPPPFADMSHNNVYFFWTDLPKRPEAGTPNQQRKIEMMQEIP